MSSTSAVTALVARPSADVLKICRAAVGRILNILALLLSVAWLPAEAQAEGAAALARAKKIVAGRCFLCHGMLGEAASELSPRLAGQNAQYIAKQLAKIQSGERESSAMRPMVGDLTFEDMRALGLYFSMQEVRGHVSADAQLIARGAAIYARGSAAAQVIACAGCHGANAHGSETLPRLAGQVAAYIVARLKNFGARRQLEGDAAMHDIAAKMVEQEIRAVAEYLSTLD